MARADLLNQLTPREREALALLRIGLTDAEIAKRLGISLSGAKFHTATILRKLDVNDRYEAAYYPDDCPWWVRALAPFFWFRPTGKTVLSIKTSVLGMIAASTALAGAAGGLGALALLLWLSSQSSVPSEDATGTTPAPLAQPTAGAPEPASVLQPTGQPAQVSAQFAALPAVQPVPLAAPTPGGPPPPIPTPLEPAPVDPSQTQLRALLATGSTTCFVTASSELLCAGGSFGTTPVQNGPSGQVEFASVGLEHACAMMHGGSLQCWGSNTYGQLGNGGDATQLGPDEVVGLAGTPVQLAAGVDRTCVLLSNGGVQCWGNNEAGQLGGPTNTMCLSFFACTSTPVRVCADIECATLLTDATDIALGLHHACAIAGVDRGLLCWGRGERGQLGAGATGFHDLPIIPGERFYPPSGVPSAVCATTTCSEPLTNVAEVAAGDFHTCALAGGRVKCWGANDRGQLGNGTSSSASTPVDVDGLPANVQSIAVGGSHTCALTRTGQISCWGANDSGQLGDGTTTDRSAPALVRNLGVNVRAIAAGAEHTCAIDDTERAMCWGANLNGQLADGRLDDRPLPEAVAWAPLPEGPGPAFVVDCDALRSGVQQRCSYGLGASFDVQLHIERPPQRGYNALQVVAEWDGPLGYLPRGDPLELLEGLEALEQLTPGKRPPEAAWTGCSIAARRYEATFVAFACVLMPRSGLRHDAGIVLQFQFRCASRGEGAIALRFMTPSGDGTFFVGPVAVPGVGVREGRIAADLRAAGITCG